MEIMHDTKAKGIMTGMFCNSSHEMIDKFIVQIMEDCDAIWVHDSNPKKPHAELTSGKCSNGFFNCLKALKYVNINEVFAHHLAMKIRKEIGDIPVDWVIGSPMAGITFSYAVARHLDAGMHFFTEKDPEVKDGMLWKREIIPEGDSVLQIEELITTSKTLNAVRDAIEQSNPYPVNWIPVVGVFLHRPDKLPKTHYGDRKVIALYEKEVWAVEAPCELCKKGSPRFRPKTNWKELTGR